MTPTIGVRREDKNEWERRVPLSPFDLAALQRDDALQFLVQPSAIRIFSDDEYLKAGLTIAEDLSPASMIFAVKEVPTPLLMPGMTYVYFAHVIKAQPHNMDMLRRLLELGCTLIDYERIVDDHNRRLIFFGVHAGYAGMVETLRCLGQRLRLAGHPNPFAAVRSCYEYASLGDAKAHLRAIGAEILAEGIDPAIGRLVFGFSGYGNTSKGAQEVLDCLPVTEITVDALPKAATAADGPILTKVVFKEEHTVRPAEAGQPFELGDYYAHPERYVSRFDEHLPYLDVLVNAIYWEDRAPRLVTREWAQAQLRDAGGSRLKVIGDISCDIEGSIEITVKSTDADNPCFVWDPATDSIRDGYAGPGIAIMAVDNLPGELPRESSNHFSATLRDMVGPLARAHWHEGYDDLDLPPHLKRAVIVHRGQLTPPYQYLEPHVRG